MEEARERKLEQLKLASPLEVTQILQEMELYDAKSSQEIIDEVYQQFATGENITQEVVKPVFLSILDGFLEGTKFGRSARKKGLTASRVMQECEEFSYAEKLSVESNSDGYTEYKNAQHYELEYQINKGESEYHGEVNSNTHQQYERSNYEDARKMKRYKEKKLCGEKTLTDEYTGKKNLYLSKDNPNQKYNDPTHRKQAQPDHIVPLKKIHEQFKHNYALDDADIRAISNIEGNFAVTSADINQKKRDLTNKEFIKKCESEGTPLDENTRKIMLDKQKEAEKAINKAANKKVAQNLLGKGSVSNKDVKDAIEKYEKENDGRKPTNEEIDKIKGKLAKKKTGEIWGNTTSKAAKQAKDNAVGNVILYLIKPLYYEVSDIFKNGMKEGVGATTNGEALKIRFTRVKNYIIANTAAFLGDSILEFVKGFVSSLIENIVGLFVGMLSKILKIIKEGIKIFVQSAKILFGKDSKDRTPAQKGDAIVKIIGGSVIGIAGLTIGSILNKIGIGEPWSDIISTILSGIASALFMYMLDKVDLFSVKAEKRKERILEIFQERINDIEETTQSCNLIAIERLREQREEFEKVSAQIDCGIASNDIDKLNSGLYRMADFMKVDLGYSNTDEFCDYMDSQDTIYL